MKVNCSYTKLVPIEELVPNPSNPNLHSPDQVKRLAAILKFQGWRNPIVVSKVSGFIVKGHGRLEAAKQAGFEEVPVDEQDYETPAMEHADLIADNRIAELSEWNNTMLKDMLADLDTGEIDLESTGYSTEELERLVSQFHTESPEEFPSMDEDIKTDYECPKCGYTWSGKKA